MGLQIGRLIGHHGVGGGVALVETVLGETGDQFVDFLGGGFRNMVLHRPLDEVSRQ